MTSALTMYFHPGRAPPPPADEVSGHCVADAISVFRTNPGATPALSGSSSSHTRLHLPCSILRYDPFAYVAIESTDTMRSTGKITRPTNVLLGDGGQILPVFDRRRLRSTPVMAQALNTTGAIGCLGYGCAMTAILVFLPRHQVIRILR